MNDQTKTDSEGALIEGMLNNNEPAFRDAIKQYNPTMLSMARSIVGDAIAEEVVQDAWLSVLKALPTFQRRCKLKTWILQIVCNAAKTRLRHEKRFISFSDMGSRFAMALHDDSSNTGSKGQATLSVCQRHLNTPDELLASMELHEVLRQTINTLPPLQQAVLKLRDIEGMTTPEVKEVLTLTEGNIRVLLHRARLTIKHALDVYQTGHMNTTRLTSLSLSEFIFKMA